MIISLSFLGGMIGSWQVVINERISKKQRSLVSTLDEKEWVDNISAPSPPPNVSTYSFFSMSYDKHLYKHLYERKATKFELIVILPAQ